MAGARRAAAVVGFMAMGLDRGELGLDSDGEAREAGKSLGERLPVHIDGGSNLMIHGDVTGGTSPSHRFPGFLGLVHPRYDIPSIRC